MTIDTRSGASQNVSASLACAMAAVGIAAARGAKRTGAGHARQALPDRFLPLSGLVCVCPDQGAIPADPIHADAANHCGINMIRS